jgi:hypothetical protein
MARLRLDCSMCTSLKDKRRILKSILDRLGNSRLMGVAEVGDRDFWKSSVIGVVAVSSSNEMVAKALDGAERMIEASGVEIIGRQRWTIRPEDL